MGKENTRKRAIDGNPAGDVTSEVRAKVSRSNDQAASTSEASSSADQKSESRSFQGLKRSLHGASYQLKLTIYILLHAQSRKARDPMFEYYITNEDETGGAYDDIVCRFKDDGIERFLYVQTKHSSNDTNATLSGSSFTSKSSKAPFALCKYFNSFLEQSWDSGSKLRETLVCTNVDLQMDKTTTCWLKEYTFEGNTFIDGIFKQLNAKCFKFDMNADLIKYLKNHSDFRQLTEQLVECIDKQHNVDLRKPLMKKYGYAIKHQIAANNAKKGPCKAAISNFEKALNEEYKKRTGRKGDAWKDLQKLCDFDTKRLDKSELPSEVTVQQIESFMKSHVLVCKTGSDDALKTTILTMLRNTSQQLLPRDMVQSVEPELAAYMLFNEIFESVKTQIKISLKSNIIESWFKAFVVKLKLLHFKGITDTCVKKMEHMKMQFEPSRLHQTHLYRSFGTWSQNDNNVTHNEVDVAVYSYHPLVVWRILQLLKKEFLMLDGVTFVLMRDNLKPVWQSINHTLVLVLDCRDNPLDLNLLKPLTEPTQSETFYRRKIVVLQKQDTTPGSNSDELLYRDLNEASRKSIDEQNKDLKMFGTSVILQDIVSPDDSFTYFEQLISAQDTLHVRQDKNAEAFKRIDKMYVQRKWQSCENGKNEKKNDIFWKRINVNVLSKVHDNEELLANESKKISLVQLTESLHSGHPPKQSIYKEDQKRIMPPGAAKHNTMKVHIILNDAGQGKSYYLIWLAQDLQLAHPSWWVIKFNLIEYSCLFNSPDLKVLDELNALRVLFQLTYLTFYATNMSHQNAIENEQDRNAARKCSECLVFSEGLNKLRLQREKLGGVTSTQLVLLRVFVAKFNSKEMAILLDGFDEIAPYYRQIGLSLMSYLAKLQGIIKMYLTSRPYDFRQDFLNEMPGCRFFRLKKLWRDDKKMFLHRHLLNNFEHYNQYDGPVRNALMRLLTKLTDDLLGDLSCVPLFLAMALETFIPLVVSHMDLVEATIEPKVLKECQNIFELLRMMETFVEKKLSIVSTEKLGLTTTNSQSAIARLEAEERMSSTKKLHSLLALYVILSEEERNKMLTKSDLAVTLQYMQQVREGSEKSGIIEGVVDNVPMFIHRSFAEYFAANWLFIKQDNDAVKSVIKRNLFKNDSQKETRHFLDRMICKNCKLHMAVLDVCVAKVRSILKENPEQARQLDDWGRTPLHMSVMYFKNHLDSKEVFDKLLQALKDDDINVKDHLMNRSPLDYAFELGKDNYVKQQLLKKKASVNTPALLKRMLTDSSVTTTCNAAILENELMNLTEWCLSQTQASKLFETIARRVTADRNFQLYCNITQVELPTSLPKPLALKLKRLGKEKKMHRPFTMLEYCVVFDSAVLFKNLVNHIEPRTLTENIPKLWEVAMEYCSIHVMQYLIVEKQLLLPERIHFNQLVLMLMFCIKENAMNVFKILFDKYCDWYHIQHLEENEVPSTTGVTAESDEEDLMDSCDWLDLPEVPPKFQQKDHGIDTGTECLLVEAIQVNNLRATIHLIMKVHLVINNAFITNLFTNYRIGWYCERGIHFLLDKSSDLRDNHVVTGRNLLHIAAQNGWFCLAKCLIEHYKFDAELINEQEHNWNAFYYCVMEHGRPYGSQKILAFLMERHSADCFQQRDTAGHNVFYYAVKKNRLIAETILKHKCLQLTEHALEERARTLKTLIQDSGLINSEINWCFEKLHTLVPCIKKHLHLS